MKNVVLHVKNLKTTLYTDTETIEAVRGVSFQLFEGESLGVVGESGSGKSLMAKSLIQLFPLRSRFMCDGTVIFQGRHLLQEKPKEIQKIRGKEIGFIFQDPMTSLNPTMRIGEQLLEGLLLNTPNVQKKKAYQHALELLSLVGITEPQTRFKQYPHELSGGMRQRVMIAIAIITSPKLLIADEPTTSLDVTIQSQILNLLKELQRKKELSVILITHDLRVAAEFCDKILVMYSGEIVESGTVDEVFNSPKHPYTKKLIESIPHMDHSQSAMLTPIPGMPPLLSQPTGACNFAPRCRQSMPLCLEKNPPLISVNATQKTKCWLFDTQKKGGI